MPKFNLECKYCGHRWDASFWSADYVKNVTCPNGKCNDKNIIVRPLGEEGDNDTFGYKVEVPKSDKKYRY